MRTKQEPSLVPPSALHGPEVDLKGPQEPHERSLVVARLAESPAGAWGAAVTLP
jgi:hypothetical protein